MVQELREIMAELGFRTVNEMVGQVDCLEIRDDIKHWKYSKLDPRPSYTKNLLLRIHRDLHCNGRTGSWLETYLTGNCWKQAKPAHWKKEKVTGIVSYQSIQIELRHAILSNEITKKYKAGLPDDTIHFKFTGTAGQSFGAFNTRALRWNWKAMPMIILAKASVVQG
jgi:glutamate synthase (NADPH/NADH) large chain